MMTGRWSPGSTRGMGGNGSTSSLPETWWTVLQATSSVPLVAWKSRIYVQKVSIPYERLSTGLLEDFTVKYKSAVPVKAQEISH
jgi:hypothetical protein